ncbi:MAG TPA: ROK family protein [Candidatus Saccharimonadales bacterium]
MIIAVDTGGTKTLIARFSDRGVIEKSHKFPTPKDPAVYLKTLFGAIREVAEDKEISTISLASPGLIENGVVVWYDNLGWKNFNILAALKTEFPGHNVLVENDANLGGLGEARALTSSKRCMYVTVSTGIGVGVITDGKIHAGLPLSESGHMKLEFDGSLHEWEDIASGSTIYKLYGKYARDITSKRTWKEIAKRISRGFLALIPGIQPEVVIIGGSIGTYFEQFGEQLELLVREQLPKNTPCPRFIKAQHPEEAVIYGCYYHALDNAT